MTEWYYDRSTLFRQGVLQLAGLVHMRSPPPSHATALPISQGPVNTMIWLCYRLACVLLLV